ncbi:hypothetical protein VI817_007921 [Penicillium citrinum]|nr:hypothetical protein VI817_007921 [Penicillium citrinum]
MGHAEKRRVHFNELPTEILELIAMNLDFLDYLRFENGLVPKMDDLVQLKVSLKRPCGGMVERAARSRNYKMLLTLMIGHGASFREVHGGIDGLCCDAYEQGDFGKFRWLFLKGGASLDKLAGMVFLFSACRRPRTRQACRNHQVALKKALMEGSAPPASHAALAARLRKERRDACGSSQGEVWNEGPKGAILSSDQVAE